MEPPHRAPPPEPALKSQLRRQAAHAEALAPLTAGRPPFFARGLPVLMQVLASVDTYRRLAERAQLDGDEAGIVAGWAIRILLQELQSKRRGP